MFNVEKYGTGHEFDAFVDFCTQHNKPLIEKENNFNNTEVQYWLSVIFWTIYICHKLTIITKLCQYLLKVNAPSEMKNDTRLCASDAFIDLWSIHNKYEKEKQLHKQKFILALSIFVTACIYMYSDETLQKL